ncbi:MAG: sigma-70 family RNA polymerase sigma factor [Candidatus Marinimicrobia bacterium]|jgi:RNA polymerase sigma-70 factor (ECF subfamily)|nr:sigma-70 family RNA polymerase sigma factor [Candidatus Neomarinimicrobiota bacterium]
MTDFELSDEILIKKFQDGDVGAYNQIVYRYKDRLYNFIYRFVTDLDLAEDLVQDTLLKLYTHKHSYQEIAKFSTWLYTIAANLARTELRKKKRRKTFSVTELSYDDREFIISSTEGDPSQENTTRDFEKNVQRALAELPDDFKTIIILRDIQELSYDEISKIVAVPLGTVKSRINRGRVKLQQLLKKKGERPY